MDFVTDNQQSRPDTQCEVSKRWGMGISGSLRWFTSVDCVRPRYRDSAIFLCYESSGLGLAPNNGKQEPPPPCQAKILNATNNQFGTNYTDANVSSTFNYSTGAGPGQGTLNLNITGSTAGVSTGYYPVHWWTYAIGYGPTLHVVGGDVFDSPQTLQFGPNQGTFHIDSGFPLNPIGAFFHWLLNMTKAGG